MEEAEMYANTDVKKIGDWSEQNKIQFNEVKSKVLLVTRKIREQLVFTYLNNKTLEQVQEIKYLGIILYLTVNYSSINTSNMSVTDALH